MTQAEFAKALLALWIEATQRGLKAKRTPDRLLVSVTYQSAEALPDEDRDQPPFGLEGELLSVRDDQLTFNYSCGYLDVACYLAASGLLRMRRGVRADFGDNR